MQKQRELKQIAELVKMDEEKLEAERKRRWFEAQITKIIIVLKNQGKIYIVDSCLDFAC